MSGFDYEIWFFLFFPSWALTCFYSHFGGLCLKNEAIIFIFNRIKISCEYNFWRKIVFSRKFSEDVSKFHDKKIYKFIDIVGRLLRVLRCLVCPIIHFWLRSREVSSLPKIVSNACIVATKQYFKLKSTFSGRLFKKFKNLARLFMCS